MKSQCPITIYIMGLGIDETYMKKYKSLTVPSRTKYVFYDQSKEISHYDQYIENYGENVNLVGFSMGCIVCLHLLEKYEFLIDNIILIGLPSSFHETFDINSHFFDHDSKSQQLYSPLKYNVKNTLLFNTLFRLSKVLEFLPFGTFLSKRIYRMFNPDTPSVVVDTICRTPLHKTVVQVNKHLMNSNMLSMIRKCKKTIHYVVGRDDEFAFVSNILSEHTNNSVLHVCNECNHHVFYHEPNYLHLRISAILCDSVV